jgi:site-specific recombinase XerD
LSTALKTSRARPPISRWRDFARNEKADSTRRAYGVDFDAFVAWCSSRQVAAVPATPETIAGFLAAEAARGIKPSSIGRRVAAIRYAHKLAGTGEPPTKQRDREVDGPRDLHRRRRPGPQSTRHRRQGGGDGHRRAPRHEGPS